MSKDKAQAAPASHDEVDLDELLDVSRSTKFTYLLYLLSVYSKLYLILSVVKFLGTSRQDPELEKLHAERIAALKVLFCIFHL